MLYGIVFYFGWFKKGLDICIVILKQSFTLKKLIPIET